MTVRRKRIMDTDRTFSIENPIMDSPYGNIFKMTRNSIDMFKSQLYTLIFTNKGERVMYPEYGTRIQEMLFEPFTENIYINIEKEIKQSAARWVPGIIIDEIIFDDADDNLDNNRISITIKFSLAVDPSISDQIQIEKSI